MLACAYVSVGREVHAAAARQVRRGVANGRLLLRRAAAGDAQHDAPLAHGLGAAVDADGLPVLELAAARAEHHEVRVVQGILLLR